MSSKMLKKLSSLLIIGALVVTGCDQTTSVNKQDELTNEDKAEQILAKQNQPIDGRYIVVFKEEGNERRMAKAQRAQQVQRKINAVATENNIPQEKIRSSYKYSVSGFTAELDDDQLTALRNDDRVDYIEQDRIVILSPPKATQTFWCIYFGIGCDYGGGDPQVTPYGINRVGGSVDGSGLTAWVIDTGVDLDHNDLNVNTQMSTSFVTTESSADDGNGHGTHVAGTIAALDNDIDVVGVAAGASVVGVKVLDSNGSGAYSGVIDGIDYVAETDHPAMWPT